MSDNTFQGNEIKLEIKERENGRGRAGKREDK